MVCACKWLNNQYKWLEKSALQKSNDLLLYLELWSWTSFNDGHDVCEVPPCWIDHQQPSLLLLGILTPRGHQAAPLKPLKISPKWWKPREKVTPSSFKVSGLTQLRSDPESPLALKWTLCTVVRANSSCDLTRQTLCLGLTHHSAD